MKQTKTTRWSARLRLFAASLMFGLLVMPVAGGLLSSGTISVPRASAQEEQKPNPNPDVPVIEDRPITFDCPEGQCIIDKYVVPITNTLSAMVGIAVTASIIYGGIQYGSSANNPQKVSAAKQRIVNSIFVLVGFFLFYAFLNWIVPGGLLK